MTKQTVYGTTAEDFEKTLKNRLRFDGVLVGATLLLNILLTIFRNDSNHTWFLLANILTDIGCGMYLVFDLSFRYVPQRRLLKLNKRMKETYSGQITEIEPYSTRYADLDCYCVKLGKRRTFLPTDTLQLEVGMEVELTLSGNVILEVAQ